MNEVRTYAFTLTVTVEENQAGYDDPEWIADAAWGSLSNEYGYRCVYDIVASDPPRVL